jgi:ABC-type phosphate transport system substrate-binding protein
MTFLSPRRLIWACAVSAASMAALIAPGAANASLGTQCSGSPLVAAGSTLQKLAQVSVWDPDFNTSANSTACNGTQGSGGKPKISYESIGSGAGLEDWGVNKHAFEAGRVGIVATDEPPNAAQIAEIDSHGKADTVETLPVLQGAVAIIMHLPTGCTSATSTSNVGRLVINNTTLQGIFLGTIKKWSEFKEGGDKLTCGTKAEEESAITPVVRLDQSGTTHIFKKYLDLIEATAFETEKGESKTWTQISEGTENTTWPKAAKVEKPETTGGGALVSWVAAHAGTIGYANLADASGNTAFLPSPGGTGGANTATFWAPLENNGTTTKKPTYKDPATKGEEDNLSNANCSKTKYTNGKTKFPPKTTLEPWNEVTTATKETNYPLCGLSYDLTFTAYSDYTGTTKEEATTANNFVTFILSTAAEGGQALIVNHDYEPLTSPLDKEAAKGAKATGF